MEMKFGPPPVGRMTTVVRDLPESVTPLNWRVNRRLAEKSDLEARPVKHMYGAVLQKEETLVKDLQEYVDNHQYLGERKKEMLHKNWNERVHEPIRKAIIKEMDGENYNNFKRRKDQLYREYIEHSNKKGHVFRDDYDPSEYYAMGLHANRPMVVAGMQANIETPLQDPTLLQSDMRDAEDQTIIRCTSGSKYRGKSLDTIRLPSLPLVPQGRHGTENDTWIAMPLTNIESSVRQASRRRMIGANLKSEINFGNWSVQKYGKETQDKEMGIQRRRQCPQPPLTAPRIIGYGRKKLPAAKENHKSRTLPFASPKYHRDYDCPFGLDEPVYTSAEANEKEDTRWRQHTAPAASHSNVTFNDTVETIPEHSAAKLHSPVQQMDAPLMPN